MRVAVLDKTKGITRWGELALAGFREAGHQAVFGSTRNPSLHPAINRLLASKSLGVPRAVALSRMVRRFGPDIIVAVGAFKMPASILEHIAHLPNRPPIVAWIGEDWSDEEGEKLRWLDAVAYTDSGLVAQHLRQYPDYPRVAYIPHAVSPAVSPSKPAVGQRITRMAFVANPTPYRVQSVNGITLPISLYGPGWRGNVTGQRHVVAARRLGTEAVQNVYRTHFAVLNLRNEGHVIVGLNQRSFDPYLFGTPVVSDNQPDLSRCFDEGSEVFVFNSIAEANEIYDRITRDPAKAADVGARGRRRVLSDHTYGRRLKSLANLVGVTV